MQQLAQVAQANDDQLAVGIPRAARILDVSENHIRNLIDRGKLKRIRLGRRALVTMGSIHSLLNEDGSTVEDHKP